MTSTDRPTESTDASFTLPPVADLEAMGMGVGLYLPTTMEEHPDPAGGDAPPRVSARFDTAPQFLDGRGRLATGVLATLIDNVGGMACGLGVLPDWVVTTNLTLRRSTDRPPEAGDGPVLLDARVLRRGRTSVVTEVVVTRDDTSVVATAWLTSAVLTPENGPPPVPRPLGRRVMPVIDDPRYRATPAVFMGLEPGERPGEVRLVAAPRVRNPWGIVHGGALAVAADAAARAAVAHPTGLDLSDDDLVVTDLVAQYLSPARVGPVLAAAEVVGSRAGDHLVRVTVRDRGADDRSCVLAVATVRAD